MVLAAVYSPNFQQLVALRFHEPEIVITTSNTPQGMSMNLFIIFEAKNTVAMNCEFL